MRSKFFTVLLAAMSLGGSAMADANGLAGDFAMRCWDQSFAYNQLDIKANQGRVKFKLSGLNLVVSNKVIDTSKLGYLSAEFSVLVANCTQASSDPKILACEDSIHLHVTPSQSSTSYAAVDVEIPDATIQVHKVTELPTLGNEAIGYAISVRGVGPHSEAILEQNYFDGAYADESRNCIIGQSSAH